MTAGDRKKNDESALLSPREEVVLRLLARGLTVSEIARDTHRSVKTVSQQKRNAMQRLGIHSDYKLFEYLHSQALRIPTQSRTLSLG